MGRVVAVSLNIKHSFSKFNREKIELIEGIGVRGDAHAGEKVQHRSRVAKNPNQPNLRQVHLIHAELYDELKQRFELQPGQMGENITTREIDLLGLPTNTRLHIGKQAVVEITGLRNPCSQLDNFKRGLMAAVLDKDANGNLIRKAGIMGIVATAGEVLIGDTIRIELPPQPYKSLERV